MALTEDDVRRIADYTRIALTKEQVEATTTYLNGMLRTLDPITQYDLDDVPPTYHPIGDLSNIVRDDVTEPSLSHDATFLDAPAEDDGHFVVPRILGGGE